MRALLWAAAIGEHADVLDCFSCHLWATELVHYYWSKARYNTNRRSFRAVVSQNAACSKKRQKETADRNDALRSASCKSRGIRVLLGKFNKYERYREKFIQTNILVANLIWVILMLTIDDMTTPYSQQPAGFPVWSTRRRSKEQYQPCMDAISLISWRNFVTLHRSYFSEPSVSSENDVSCTYSPWKHISDLKKKY